MKYCAYALAALLSIPLCTLSMEKENDPVATDGWYDQRGDEDENDQYTLVDYGTFFNLPGGMCMPLDSGTLTIGDFFKGSYVEFSYEGIKPKTRIIKIYKEKKLQAIAYVDENNPAYSDPFIVASDTKNPTSVIINFSKTINELNLCSENAENAEKILLNIKLTKNNKKVVSLAKKIAELSDKN